ncbi:hypothetical protein [Companilactobacillus ginsenosidimutans]|uniref:hypothetical protein n=1 Tax=Companilactobacillus ginsenosidimutans TaxID=1007676 RepID=UPI000A5F65A0|nr:hypothetical protein [Companilactobacillus ginsenosidimutans]
MKNIPLAIYQMKANGYTNIEIADALRISDEELCKQMERIKRDEQAFERRNQLEL